MKLAILIISFMFSSEVFAASATTSCAPRKSYSSYSGVIPKTFRLVPPCLGVPDPKVYIDYALFVGGAEVAGYIYYDPEQMDEPIFTADKMSQAILPSFDYDLKLLDSEISNIRDFEFPKTSCWHTPATILVKRIEHIDDGTDNSGSYLRDYKILNLGKFIETCQYNTFCNEKK